VVPTSVLLAVLVAAGLLALAPALTRRYDATERVAAERATSTARVLTRRRRRRTVPGRVPVNPPTFRARDQGSVDQPARSQENVDQRGVARARPVRRPVQRRRRPTVTALHRRRRIFVALVALNLVELAGVFLVGPGFWVGFAVSATLLVVDIAYLRHLALRTARERARAARRAAWVQAQQAAVRREHARRAAERQAAQRRATYEREQARREAARQATTYVERYTPRTAP
jgi:hypothetical protein